LKRGRILFIEVEQKVTLDLVWTIIDSLLAGKLGYDTSFSKAWKDITTSPGKNLRVDYPFVLSNGKEVTLPIWAFSIQYLKQLFESFGLTKIDKEGVHALTNLLPSTIIHQHNPNIFLRNTFIILSIIEKRVSRVWPFWLQCKLLLAKKWVVIQTLRLVPRDNY
jgi:hypothetical protein